MHDHECIWCGDRIPCHILEDRGIVCTIGDEYVCDQCREDGAEEE